MIGVVGLGISGLATINWLMERGVAVRAFDTRPAPPILAELPDEVEVHLGPLDPLELAQCLYLVVSPGIAKDHPALVKSGLEIIGDVELFARNCKAPVVAITGSNGKSTVTSLVGDMASKAGMRVAVGGNIGVPVLALPVDARLYVLELSSFQLETTTSLKPVAATILNLSPDHLDRYRTMAEYGAAKQRIYQGASHCIYNSDDAATTPPQGGVSFGSQGLYHLAGGMLMRGEEPLMATAEVRIIGRHNHMNALAALALGEAAGIPLGAMIKSLKSFRGLPHRCEVVAEKDGVLFVNDSKATNLGSLEAALDGFADIDGNIILLAGGDAKGADLSPLAARMGKVSALICFGQDGDKVAALKAGAHRVETLDEALPLAASLAKPGDLVLLSPACASLDQFTNFEARGARFRELVEAL
ncbi:UDP-N-acetylmuramoyl-L-alanine--D-glutamate ligase [Gallaecimonas pentaromativorans]|uniref:UDP-N-acetylmuramoylalanine--D-glutamate ligase n=1 Tax=Gallaecimonas pentaromativorans TaxID=584787 RepID=A0A3N1PH30_9GAMM|nr:UDP-N-acetylmuramoyl-L-alanine--D-glutamate ligase [Gallaecimonas pentaromativorans]MED5523582.1 UDP-N-acetylmuramoyl-L-alanine--D-glutamate ligase [Pseudomonadota bacterium]ROQ30772.1 UDP-N-acetylmuramoylalanine--D-glutamate ligase [Gallaecimonas pentaromativorans]